MSNSSDNPRPDATRPDPGSGAKRRAIGTPAAATPPWQKSQLQRWLREWNIYRELGTDLGAPNDVPLVSSGVSLPNPSGAELSAGVISPFDSTTESFKPGAIRLLDPALVPDAQRPVYVLILANWAEKRKLVAPFGPIEVPASTMELRSNRQEPHLAVVSLWNQRVLSTEMLARSWFVDRFEEEELDDALAVWESGMLGAVLPAHLNALIGPPIERQDDPRCEYQREEVSVFAAIDAEILASTALDPGVRTSEISDPELRERVGLEDIELDPNKIIRVSNWELSAFLQPFADWFYSSDSRAAAASVLRPPFCLKRSAIGRTGLILSIKTQPTGDKCKITVLEGKERSSKLDETRFVPRHGPAVVIRGGHAVCPLSAIYPGAGKKGGYKLVAEDGTRLQLKDL